MNRYRYRLVFNRAKGQLVVAAELGMTRGKGGSVAEGPAGDTPPSTFPLGRLTPLCRAILVASGLAFALPAQAQILPDRNAPGGQRPHVLESANGTPQVNIQTPSAQGVSRNAYRQFDVDGNGAILNNARQATQTQLGGWVQGNPNLATGEARVIVNEVNSRDPSQLRGHVEVAGRRAEMVIANPAGIHVDGAGFINASGTTLTTGRPEFRGGELTGYRVEEGTIRIAGDGLDTRDSDYTAILARAVEVQAGLWADDLDVVAGANRISVDHQAVTPIEGSGNAPAVAIDVAHLGGMYAGKIHLMATERGVGVHHAGALSAGEIVVDADGRITNRGQIVTDGDIRLASHNDIANHGLVRAGNDLAATSEAEIANRDTGMLIARGDVQLSASDLRSDRDALMAAGVRDDGTLGADGDLAVTATQTIDASGLHLAAGGIYAQADAVALRDGHAQARDIDIVAGQGGIDASRATLAAQETLSARTPGALRTDAARVVADRLDLDANELSNIGGDIVQLGSDSLALDVATFDNTSGRLASNSDRLTIDAGAFVNRGGELLHAGNERLTLGVGALDNDDGRLLGNAELAVTAGEVSNVGGRLQGNDAVRLSATALDNRQGDLVTGDALTLAIDGDVDNTQGQWRAERIDASAATLNNTDGLISAASGDLHLDANELDNTAGRLEAADDLTLDIAETLINQDGEIIHAGEGAARIAATRLDGRDGLIVSQGDLTLTARDIVLDGAVTNADAIALSAERLSHRQGEILHTGDGRDLSLTIGQSLDNTDGVIASNTGLEITARALINRSGTVQSRDDLRLDTEGLDNRDGDIASGEALTLATGSGALDNRDGRLIAEGNVGVTGRRLDNRDGMIGAVQGTLDVDVGTLDNRRGRLEATGDLALAIADTLTNQDGEIIHAGDGDARIIATRLEGGDGLIVSQGDLILDARDIVLDGATTSAEAIALSAERLSHRQGEMLHTGDDRDLILTIGQSLDNTEGLIASNTGLDILAGELTNAAGTLQALGDLSLNAESLNNRQGELIAGDALMLTAEGDIDNTQGQWLAERIDVTAAGLDNTDGLISAASGALRVRANDLDNTAGRLEASGDLTLDVAEILINEDGEIIHAGDGEARIAATRLEGSDGLIISQGDLTLDARDIVLDGATTSAESLVLSAERLSHRQGEILHTGDDRDLTLTIGQSLDNTEGLIASNTGLDITVPELINTGGTLQALGDLSLNAESLNNRQGELIAGDALMLTAEGDIDNTRGQWLAERIDVTAAGLNNTDGLISAASGDLHLDAHDLDNSRGRLEAADDLTLDIAETLINQDGEIIHAGDGEARIVATHLEGSDGLIVSQGDLTLAASDVILDGATTSAESIALTAERLSHRQGEMLHTGDDRDLTLTIGQSLDNSDGVIASNTGLDLTTRELTNVAGTLQALGDLSLNVENLNNRQGDLVAGDALILAVEGNIDNTQGQWLAERIDVTAAGLDNTDGLISAASGDLYIEADDLDNTSGRLEAAGDLSLDIAGTLTNEDGEIIHAGDGEARIVATRLDGSDGLIVSQGDLTLAARDIILDGATTSAEAIALSAERLSHRQGEMLHTGDDSDLILAIQQSLDNTEGLIASNTGLEITAQALTNTAGTLQALDNVRLDVGTLNNQQGDIVAGDALTLAVEGNVDNTQGQWLAERIDVTAAGLDNTDGLISAASGELRVRADNLDNTSGRLEATDDLALDVAETLTNQDGEIIHAGDGEARIVATHLEGSEGVIVSQGDLTLAAGDIVLDGATTSAERIMVDAARLSHRQGEMLHTGDDRDLTLTMGQSLDNTGGLIASNTGLDILAGELTNTAGTLQALGDLSLNAESLNNRQGELIAGDALTLAVEGNIDNTQGQWLAERIDVTAAGLDNTDGLISAASGALRVRANDLDNTSGRLEAAGDLTLDVAETLINQDGEIIHAGEGEARIAATRLEGSDGLIISQGDLTLDARDIVLDGATTSAEAIALSAERLSHRQGEMLHTGDDRDLTLTMGQSLDNTDGVIASNTGLDITVPELINTGGTLQALGDLDLNVENLNNRQGDLVAGDALALVATGDIDNTQGQWLAERIDVTAADLDNTDGLISAASGDLHIEANDLDNTSGRLESADDLTLDIAETLTNEDGEIIHAGEGEARIVVTHLEGSDGLIVSQGDLTLAASDVILDGATTSAESIALTAERLSHRQGEMLHTGDDRDLTLTIGQSLDNSEGLIASNTGLEITAGELTNTAGTLQALGDLSLNVENLNNRQGDLVAGDVLILAVEGNIDNTQGQWLAERIDVTAAGLDNTDGLISAASGDLHIEANDLDNTSGRLESADDLTLDIAETLINDDGEIIHAGDGEARIAATRLDGREGLIVSQGDLTLAARDIVLDGAVTNADAITLTAERLSHRQGEMLHTGDDSDLILAIQQSLDNTEGLIASNTGLEITAEALTNTAGTLQALDNVRLDVGTLNNQQGDIVAGDALALVATGDIDNTQGQWLAERIDVTAAGLNNTDGLISAASGELRVRADGLDNTTGRLEAAGDLSLIIAETLINEDGEIIHAGDGEARIVATRLEGSEGLIVSQGDLTLTARDIVLDGAVTNADAIALTAERLSHRQGEMLQTGDDSDLTLTIGQSLDNTDGMIAGNAGLDITASALINAAGLLQAVGDMHLDTGGVDNRGGEIVVGGALTLATGSGDLNNRDGRLIAEGEIGITGAALDNQGGLIGAVQGPLSLEVGALDNSQGRLEATGDLILDVAGTLTNEDGEIIHAGDGEARIVATRLDGSDGLTISQGDLTLAAGDIVLDGATTSAESLALSAERLSHRQGEMLHTGDDRDLILTIGQSLDNTGGQIASNAGLDISTGDINNQDGILQAIADLRLDTGDMNNRRGEVVTAGQLTVTASGNVDNRDGELIGEQGIDLRAASLDNREGTLGALQGRLAVQAGTLDNTQGRVETAGDLSLDIAGTLINEDGEIVHAGDGEARIVATRLEGSDGLIVSQGDLTLTADRLVLDGAVTSAERITVDANRLSHRQGEMLHTGDDHALVLNIGQSLDNREGHIASHGELHIDAGDLVNRAGLLQAAGDVSLTSGALDNRQGEILAGGALDLDASGALDNAGGRIVAARDATLSAASLVNVDGTLATREGDLTLAIAGAIDNRLGRLDVGGDLVSTSRALDNRDGEIVATRVNLDTQERNLDNRGGLIAAHDALTLASGALDNTGGTLQAGGDVTLDTHGRALINADGGTLLSEGALTLTVGNLDNTAGLIGAGAGLDLQANGIVNRHGGTLLSEADMHVTAASLDNDGGQLQALGDLILGIGGTLSNQGGLLRAGQSLVLNASQVLNRHTQGDDQGIEGRTVHIDTASLDNRQGTLRADQRVELQVDGAINNRNGLISSLHTLAIQAGEIDNRDGTLIADHHLDLVTARLTGDGRILSLGDLALQLASDFTLDEGGELMAEGDLSLVTSGTLDNRGRLRAGETLAIDAERLINAASGELSGDTTLIDVGHLTNRGLIDGVETHIVADVLDNLGSGRLYGDWLSIQAGTLTNDHEDGQAAVIAARERLDLGVGTLINRDDALIFSAGDMAIGGALNATGRATGQANRIHNASATIEALGNLNLSTARLDNTNEDFETELVQIGGLPQGLYIQPEGWDDKELESRFFWANSSETLDGMYRYWDTREAVRNWTEYDIERTEYESRVVRSRPGQILAGGNMHLSGGELINDKSQILAGGALSGDLERLENREALGGRYVEETGTSRSSYLRYLCGIYRPNSKPCTEMHVRPYAREWTEWQPYSYSGNVGTFELPVTAVGGNRAIDGSGAQLSAHTGASFDASAQGARGAQVDLQANGTGGGIIEVPAVNPPAVSADTSLDQGNWHPGDMADIEGWAATPAGLLLEAIGTGTATVADVERLVAALTDMVGGPTDVDSLTTTNHQIDASDVERLVATLAEMVRASTDIDALASTNHSIDATDVERLVAALTDMVGGPSGVDSLTTTNHQIDASDVERLVAVLAGLVGVSTGTDITAADIERWAAIPADLRQDAIAADLSAAADLDSLGVIRSVTPNIVLPSNSLFQINAQPTARYLVETDPRFTNQREWLGSDYMLDALKSDPSTTQRRLGDGFYEQRLINEQIMQLTGQRYLGGHRDDDAQYRALMNAGITFAEQHGLRPGVALTAEQMAQLTSDIVWLVEQTVTLDDGSTVEILVPQVYVRVREGDLNGDGTLIAGNSLALDVAGDILNTGTLAGREVVSLTADNIANLGGSIGGNMIDLEARSDLDNIGGEIVAGESLALRAGRDLTLASTTERLAGLYVTEAGGSLSAEAGRDLSVVGAELDSAGDLRLGAGRDLEVTSTLVSEQINRGYRQTSTELERSATLRAGNDLVLDAGRDLALVAAEVSAGGDGRLSAGRDLTLATLETGGTEQRRGYTREYRQDVGTHLDVGGDLELIAGRDLTARAAQVSSQGDLAALAGRDLTLVAGQSDEYSVERHGRTSITTQQTRVQGSDFTAGGELLLSAGQDLRLIGSQVRAGDDATLLAGRDVELLAADEQDYSLTESRRRGLLSSRSERREIHEIRAVVSGVESGGDLLIASGGDQTYQGARLKAGGDLGLLSEGAIHFDTASDIRSEAHERSRSNFAWQSARGEGSTRETLRQSELVAQGEMIIQAAQGITIEVPEVSAQSVRQVIDAMAEANPDLAWLQAMEARGDVDWRQVEAIHESWNYSQSGLGPGAALAVSIVAAAWAGPSAAGLVNNAIGAAMVNAGAGALAGTGAVSLINQRGDLGAALGDTLSSDSLRGAALATLSAGATQGMTDHVWGTQTDPNTGATTNLSLGEWGDIGRFAGQRATQAAIDAGIRAAIDGGSFEAHLGDSVENAIAHVVSGVLFNAVGDLADDRLWQEGDPQKIALHALIGGSISEAMGGDFATGALAAGASETLVHQLVGDASRTEFSNAAAQLVGIVAAELAGGDVNDGAFIAGQVESYNRQLHTAERELARDLAEASDGDYTLEDIEDAMRGMYNDALNEVPGSNILIDLQDDLDSIRAASFDSGGEWKTLSGTDGNARFMMQVFPTDTPPELIAYIIEQTGGDDSPYRTAVYRLPAEDAAPGQPRDRLTGRPLNEDGQYIVSYMLDGTVYHVPHFSCADAACIAQGANIDYSDSAAQAWSRAMNAQAMRDAGKAASAAAVIHPVGLAGTVAIGTGTGVNVGAAYLEDATGKELLKEGAISLIDRNLRSRGISEAQSIRTIQILEILGLWDSAAESAITPPSKER